MNKNRPQYIKYKQTYSALLFSPSTLLANWLSCDFDFVRGWESGIRTPVWCFFLAGGVEGTLPLSFNPKI